MPFIHSQTHTHTNTHAYTHTCVHTQGVTYSLSALSLALSELPRALVPHAPDSTAAEAQQGVLQDAVHDAVRQLAVEVGDAEQVCVCAHVCVQMCVCVPLLTLLQGVLHIARCCATDGRQLT
jgi:hypothetical protein